jgi:hypothetical protein
MEALLMLRRLVPAAALAATLAAALAAVALPAPLAAQAARAGEVKALRYHFTMVTGEERETRGTVTMLDDRARIEVEKGSSARVGTRTVGATASSDGGRTWFLLTDKGRRIAVVDDEQESFQEMDAASFTGLIGTVMRAMDTFMTMEIEDPSVHVQRVGDGGLVAGRKTERWAVVQEYTTNVGMLGKTSREMHRVVTDYWIAPGLTLAENPLFELVTRGETALAQGDKRYVARVDRARGSLPDGAALRVVVTSASSDLTDGKVKPPKIRRMEISDLAPATVSASLFEVPRGYEKSKSKGLSLDF